MQGERRKQKSKKDQRMHPALSPAVDNNWHAKYTNPSTPPPTFPKLLHTGRLPVLA